MRHPIHHSCATFLGSVHQASSPSASLDMDNLRSSTTIRTPSHSTNAISTERSQRGGAPRFPHVSRRNTQFKNVISGVKTRSANIIVTTQTPLRETFADDPGKCISLKLHVPESSKAGQTVFQGEITARLRGAPATSRKSRNRRAVVERGEVTGMSNNSLCQSPTRPKYTRPCTFPMWLATNRKRSSLVTR